MDRQYDEKKELILTPATAVEADCDVESRVCH